MDKAKEIAERFRSLSEEAAKKAGLEFRRVKKAGGKGGPWEAERTFGLFCPAKGEDGGCVAVAYYRISSRHPSSSFWGLTPRRLDDLKGWANKYGIPAFVVLVQSDPRIGYLVTGSAVDEARSWLSQGTTGEYKVNPPDLERMGAERFLSLDHLIRLMKVVEE